MSDKEIIKKIEQYVQSEIDSYTEDIADYIDDDKVENAHIIGELKEYREHWKDIKKIINGDTNLYAYWNLE